MSQYTYTEEVNGRGMVVRYNGPGLSRDYDTALVQSTPDADCILSMLAKAYEAGRADKAREIRNALCVHTHWGCPDTGAL